jgi:hypothetical protein
LAVVGVRIDVGASLEVPAEVEAVRFLGFDAAEERFFGGDGSEMGGTFPEFVVDMNSASLSSASLDELSSASICRSKEDAS